MANQQLVDYIKSQIAAGAQKPDIHKAVAQVGWPAQEVESAFAAVEGRPQAPAPAPQQAAPVQRPVVMQPQPQPLTQTLPFIHMHPQDGLLRSPWLWTVVTLLVLVAGGAAAYFMTPVGDMVRFYFAPVPVVMAPVATTTPVITEHMYSNAQYGFSLQYALDMQPATTTIGLPTDTIFALMPVAATYERKRFSVQASSTTAALAACSSGVVSTTTIGGTTFVVASSSDIGLGMFQDLTTYRAVHNGSCITLTIQTNGTSFAHLDAAQQALFTAEDKTIASRVDAVLQSFRFSSSTSATSSTTVQQ